MIQYKAPTVKPYTIKPLRSLWWGRTEFGIYFEDQLIRTTTLDYDNLTEYVSLMNCAWLVGHGSGYLEREFQEQTKTE